MNKKRNSAEDDEVRTKIVHSNKQFIKYNTSSDLHILW